MTLHPKEVVELARKETTLGKYLVDKIGGELRGEEGDLRGKLKVDMSKVPPTNQEAIKKQIIDFYTRHGFKVTYNKDFALDFVDNKDRTRRAMVVSYFEDTGELFVSQHSCKN